MSTTPYPRMNWTEALWWHPRAWDAVRCHTGAARAICRYCYIAVRLVNITPPLTGWPPRSWNKLETRQIARKKEETSHWKTWQKEWGVRSWHAENIESATWREESSARGWCTRDGKKKMKKDKTKDRAREKAKERKREGGMTTRIARSYSLGYNSAVLGQCKLNESFSPRRPHLLVSPPYSLVRRRGYRSPDTTDITDTESRRQACRAVVPGCSSINTKQREQWDTEVSHRPRSLDENFKARPQTTGPSFISGTNAMQLWQRRLKPLYQDIVAFFLVINLLLSKAFIRIISLSSGRKTFFIIKLIFNMESRLRHNPITISLI